MSASSSISSTSSRRSNSSSAQTANYSVTTSSSSSSSSSSSAAASASASACLTVPTRFESVVSIPTLPIQCAAIQLFKPRHTLGLASVCLITTPYCLYFHCLTASSSHSDSHSLRSPLAPLSVRVPSGRRDPALISTARNEWLNTSGNTWLTARWAPQSPLLITLTSNGRAFIVSAPISHSGPNELRHPYDLTPFLQQDLSTGRSAAAVASSSSPSDSTLFLNDLASPLHMTAACFLPLDAKSESAVGSKSSRLLLALGSRAGIISLFYLCPLSYSLSFADSIIVSNTLQHWITAIDSVRLNDNCHVLAAGSSDGRTTVYSCVISQASDSSHSISISPVTNVMSRFSAPVHLLTFSPPPRSSQLHSVSVSANNCSESKETQATLPSRNQSSGAQCGSGHLYLAIGSGSSIDLLSLHSDLTRWALHSLPAIHSRIISSLSFTYSDPDSNSISTSNTSREILSSARPTLSLLLFSSSADDTVCRWLIHDNLCSPHNHYYYYSHSHPGSHRKIRHEIAFQPKFLVVCGRYGVAVDGAFLYSLRHTLISPSGTQSNSNRGSSMLSISSLRITPLPPISLPWDVSAYLAREEHVADEKKKTRSSDWKDRKSVTRVKESEEGKRARLEEQEKVILQLLASSMSCPDLTVTSVMECWWEWFDVLTERTGGWLSLMLWPIFQPRPRPPQIWARKLPFSHFPFILGLDAVPHTLIPLINPLLTTANLSHLIATLTASSQGSSSSSPDSPAASLPTYLFAQSQFQSQSVPAVLALFLVSSAVLNFANSQETSPLFPLEGDSRKLAQAALQTLDLFLCCLTVAVRLTEPITSNNNPNGNLGDSTSTSAALSRLLMSDWILNGSLETDIEKVSSSHMEIEMEMETAGPSRNVLHGTSGGSAINGGLLASASASDCCSLLLPLALWSYKRASDSEAEKVHLCQSLLNRKPKARDPLGMSLLTAREQCFYCRGGIRIQSANAGVCERGHSFRRHHKTFLLVPP